VFVNFFAFIAISSALGGDALNGYARDGHYYVASHGSYTEVSQTVWTLNRIHALLTMLSWPAVMLAMAFMVFRYAFPLAMGRRTGGQDDDSRVAGIRTSGAALWSGYPGGVAGGLNATMGMLGASLHPGGIVVLLRFMRPVAIPTEEIRSVRFGRRLVSPTIVIEHDGVDVNSPLLLYGGPDSPQAQAIKAIFERAGRPMADVTSSTSAPTPLTREAPSAAPRPAMPMRVLSLFGLAVGLGLVIYGLLVAIPQLGAFGIAWTAIGVVILIVNTTRFIRRGY
jgi:hypothetical protein